MIHINKTSISVLTFFLVVFILFLYLKPEITGMVTVAPSLNQTTYFSNSLVGGTALLTFKTGDAIPAAAKITLAVVNSTLPTAEDNGVKTSSTSKDISTIITDISSAMGTTEDKEINNPEAPWEFKPSNVYAFSLDKSYTIDLKDFNLNIPDISGWNPRSYDVIINITWLCTTTDGGCNLDANYNISSKRTTIIVRSNNISLINPPTITNITGGARFRVNDYINCTAAITDVNDDSPSTINATFWGPSKTYKYENGNKNACTGASWSSGKSCSISTQITSSSIAKNSDLGFWNCSISVYDGYGINTSINSSNILAMNNTPVTFVGKFSNITFYNGTSQDNAITLEASSTSGNGFYDPDSSLNITVIGNSSMINITINSNNQVSLSGKYKNTTGIFQIYFNATDSQTGEISSARSNNITVNISKPSILSIACTSSWSCLDWSSCLSGEQTRVCTDLNSCNSLNLSYTERKTCTETPPPPSLPSQQETQPSSSTSDLLKKEAPKQETKTDTTKIAILGIAIIAGLASLSGAGYFIYKYISKSKEPIVEIPRETREIQKEEIKFARQSEEKPVTIANIDDLKKYVIQALKIKTPIPKIKEDLIKAGWQENQIEDTLNLITLKNFIQIKLNQGMKREAIIEMLKIKGWKEEMIESALSEVSEKPLL